MVIHAAYYLIGKFYGLYFPQTVKSFSFKQLTAELLLHFCSMLML